MTLYPLPEAPDGHSWKRPASAECPHCPCHAERVCVLFLWHRADPPLHADGTPYNVVCPCEKKASMPLERTVWIELDGILRQVTARYHRTGLLAGRMMTERVFRAESTVHGVCPVPVPMLLHRPTADTDRRLTVVDDHGAPWTMSFTAQHSLTQYRIAGYAEE